MESHAIVIGIDGYDPAIGTLDGAVRDALDFAAWVTGPGGVPAANLRLLLGPDLADPPPVLPAGVSAISPASGRKIRETIGGLRGTGGKRLYFYFAGHGVAFPQWPDDPMLVPPEFIDPYYHASDLLGFKDLFNRLGDLTFQEQVCLIDACRDFALPSYEPVIPSGARFRLEERKSRQYVLFSVAPGQKAAETGQGIWTRTLLDGLTGRDYRPVKPGTSAQAPFEVRLDDLADWICGEVKLRVQRKFLKDAARYVQTPEYHRDPQGGDPVMAIFTEENVPQARLRVFVEPSRAHPTCRVAVTQYVPTLRREFVVQASPDPPLSVPVSFALAPSAYSIRAEAERFVVASRGWTVLDDPTVRLTLDAMPAPPDEFLGGPADVTRGIVVRETEEVYREGGLRGAPLSFGVSPTRSAGSGTLVVTSPDAAVWIEVLDDRRKVIHQAVGSFELDGLQPGIYRVRLSLPGAESSEETVEVRPGAETRVRPSPPATRLGAVVLDRLRGLGIGIEERGGAVDFVHPSEALGPVAGARLASLLAFAFCAAQWSEMGILERLRAIGVRRVAAESNGLLALVGAGADKTEAELEAFCAGSSLILRHGDGRNTELSDFELLSGLPAAAQRFIEIPEAGVLIAELHLPGMAPTRYSLAMLPERLTVFIAVAEADGTVEVQQYLLRLPGRSGSMSSEDAIRGVRRLGLAQSFYARGKQVEALAASGPDLQKLLEGRPLGPLLGCLAGYGLLQIGQAEEFTREALPSLLRSFPDLPDLHVLAGLCDAPERRSEHFAEALRRGLPIFSQGLRALADGSPEKPPHLAEALASLISGSPWTAWIARAPW